MRVTFHRKAHQRILYLVLFAFVFPFFNPFCPLPNAMAASAMFADIENHPARTAIETLALDGIITGAPDGLFHPEGNVTRAELATMLVKALHLNGRGQTFADTENHWARDYISIAVAHGIINGYDPDSFGPDDLVTREQLAVMVVRAAGFSPSGSTAGLPDDNLIAGYARSAVATALDRNIISLLEEGRFAPGEGATRAATASAVYAVLCTLSEDSSSGYHAPGTVPPGNQNNPNQGSPNSQGDPANTGNPGQNNNTPSANTTYSPNSTTLYAVSVANVDGGSATVAVDKSQAASGEQVAVNISNVESGKAVQSISVIDGSGQNISLTELVPGACYKFVMPASPVNVAVTLADSAIANSRINPGTIYYNVNIAAVQGGSADVAADAVMAAAGQTVTVVISNIEASRAFDSISVLDGSNQALAVTEITAGNTYSFIMPASSVNVQVALKSQPSLIQTIIISFDNEQAFTVGIAPVEGGTATVTTDCTSGLTGGTVNVNISNIPSAFSFDSITVVDDFRQLVPVTENAFGISYSFKLPSSNVTVKVKVKADPTIHTNFLTPLPITIKPVIGGSATVTASQTTALPTDLVSVDVTNMTSGCYLKSITVRDADNNIVAPESALIGRATSGNCTFQMPFSAATVEVELAYIQVSLVSVPIQIILALPYHTIHVRNITGGQAKVTVDPSSTSAGTTVNVNISCITPGRWVDRVIVTTAASSAESAVTLANSNSSTAAPSTVIPVVTVAANSQYSFTMPASDVYVDVVLKSNYYNVTATINKLNEFPAFGIQPSVKIDRGDGTYTQGTSVNGTRKEGQMLRVYIYYPQNTVWSVRMLHKNGDLESFGVFFSDSTWAQVYTYMPADDLNIVIDVTMRYARVKDPNLQ